MATAALRLSSTARGRTGRRAPIVLAIDAAGIETQNLLADDISGQALARDSLSYRDAWLYAQSRLAALLYIRSVSPQSEPGHDVAQFLNHLNDGCVPPVCTPLEIADTETACPSDARRSHAGILSV